MSFFTPPEIEGETFLDFGAAIAGNAARFADKPALILGEAELSWADYGDRVARVTGALLAEGIGRGDMVATLGDNSVAHVVLVSAVLAAGACLVPLPYSATPDALRAMMADSGSKLLFAAPAMTEVAGKIGAPKVIPMAQVEEWSHNATPAAPVPALPDAPFNIIYSSGTTGTPKGIVQDNRFRSRQLLRAGKFGLTGDARMMISTPLYSNTTMFGLLPVMALGGTIIMMSKFDVTGFLTLSQRWKATHAVLVPVQYMRLMAAEDFDQFDLSAYRLKFTTSAPMPAQLKTKIMERWPGNLIELYGMTEGGVSAALNCAEFPEKWHTVGRPTLGGEIRVIDDQGHEVAPGEMGELVGRAASMMAGYHNLPDKTAELLWRDGDGRDFIRSGDMGRIDEDGFVQLLDRKKDMIISGGFNIYAADLEAVLRQHPDVQDEAVIAVPSDKWGETPLGFVVLAKGATSSAEEIKAWANERVGKTQRLSDIVLMDDLPRSEIGKVLKRDLRAPYWSD